MMNPLLAFGCWANGGHVWGRTFVKWDGMEERKCRWCDKSEKRALRRDR